MVGRGGCRETSFCKKRSTSHEMTCQDVSHAAKCTHTCIQPRTHNIVRAIATCRRVHKHKRKLPLKRVHAVKKTQHAQSPLHHHTRVILAWFGAVSPLHTHMNTVAHKNTNIHPCTPIPTHIHNHTFKHTHTHTLAQMHACVHTCAGARTHTHTHNTQMHTHNCTGYVAVCLCLQTHLAIGIRSHTHIHTND